MATKTLLLRVRPTPPDPDETGAQRGPIMMEAILSSLHALRAKDSTIGLEMGFADGKVAFFVRATEDAAPLVESQLYAQFPDVEIDREPEGLFAPKDNEIVMTTSLALEGPEMFPIKRYPQFSDLMTRQSVDSVAAITATLVRYSKPGMRGHVQVVIAPAPGNYRRRALNFLPSFMKGFAKDSPGFANAITSTGMALGWRRFVYFVPYLLLGLLQALSGGRGGTLPSLAVGEEQSIDGTDDPESKVTTRSHDREDTMAGAVDKLNRLLFKVNIRVSVIAPETVARDAEIKVEEMFGSFRQFTLPQSNGFMRRTLKQVPSIPFGFQEVPFILSAEEIATLWHIPSVMVKTPNMDWVLSKKLEPPIDLPAPGITDKEEELTTLGEAVFQGQRMRFGVRPDDRRRHIYIIGKTGMGKSTLLNNMIYSDIQAGRGIGLIDPHGDLVEDVLTFVPKSRTNDVILFDPADRGFPISFNMLECPQPDQRPLVASGLMSVFTKLWPDAFSGRMEHILRNTLLALLSNEGSSMLGILRMFGDDPYREKVVSHIDDPVVKSFWEVEYTGWSDKYRTEAVAAIQNKVGQLLTTPLIRNIVGQVRSTLDIRHAMDTGKIVLVNLSKGRIGEDTSAFLGSMLVTKFQIDAMSRADIPEAERKDFYLYVDEFQNFATESFATILSEARKYRLALTMANQYVSQLIIGDSNTKLRDAVFGNVGTLASFQVGSDDAETLSLQFEEAVTAKDILSLPKYHAYMRLMINGMASKPFSVSTLPPPESDNSSKRLQTLRDLSRERYAKPRAEVEEKILRWAATAAEGQAKAKEEAKRKEKEGEERKKARAKKMSLEEYRAWRDREMQLNQYNSFRKKKFNNEQLTGAEEAEMKELEKKLEASGGIPPPSKTMLGNKKKDDQSKDADKKPDEKA